MVAGWLLLIGHPSPKTLLEDSMAVLVAKPEYCPKKLVYKGQFYTLNPAEEVPDEFAKSMVAAYPHAFSVEKKQLEDVLIDAEPKIPIVIDGVLGKTKKAPKGS
jgi:hypothetical protein